MRTKNCVIWSEGMLLQPQHLQQQDAYWHNYIESRVCHLSPNNWGFSKLKIDGQQLIQGSIAIKECQGVFADGTPFNLPEDGPLPLPLKIEEGIQRTQIVLALPYVRPGVEEVESSMISEPNNFKSQPFARLKPLETSVEDYQGSKISATVVVGQLRVRLSLVDEVSNTYTTLGVVEVIEKKADGSISINPDFCPPCLNFRVADKISSFVDELAGLLQQRAQSLATRLGEPSHEGAAEISDFLMQMLINRNSPVFAHLATVQNIHPEVIYRQCLALAGELATLTKASKLPAFFPVYSHNQLLETFSPVIEELRKTLSVVVDTLAIPLPLEERKYGIRVAIIPDPTLINNAQFIIAVTAHIEHESLRVSFPPKVKISNVEKIRDLVNLQLPGIALKALPVAPRQLPYHAGYTYFELDRSSNLWQSMSGTAGIALHIAGDFPGLRIELWAVRQ